jgi:hypothetical protein
MYARAVDDAALRLRELRHAEREDLMLGAVALAAAVVAAQLRQPLALPLFLGGLGIGLAGLRALWSRWDLVERLSGERDAYVIPEVRSRASREAAMDRRVLHADRIRSWIRCPGPGCEARVGLAATELTALADELADDRLELDPPCAVACLRLLTDPETSPLLDHSLPPAELRSAVVRIRAGFRPRTPPTTTASPV